ncbi:MAG: NUDIX hydrolase [Nanoarchaeota archaeon]
MVFRRRRGVAIVETNEGILVVATKRKWFILPGGGAEKWESRKKATIRELYEETGLKTKNLTYLFSHKGKVHNFKGRNVINYSKVFLVKSEGNPKPNNEIEHIDFWREGKKINISESTKDIINQYLSSKLQHEQV